MAKYDWGKIFLLVEEFAPQRETLESLANAIGSRIGQQVKRTTLRDALKRKWGTSNLDELKSLLNLGEDYDPLAGALLKYLQGKRSEALSLMHLSEQFDRSPSSILSAVETLRDEHEFYIDVTDDRHVYMPDVIPATGGSLPVEVWTKPTAIHRYGVVSDTHLANRNARLDALELLYDLFKNEGIETVLHAGNIIDGECDYNRHELLAHGVEGQIAFCAKHYPQRDGITTAFISADDHEGWWAKKTGLDIGRRIENGLREHGRGDFKWLGHTERDLQLSENNPRTVLRIAHPGGGTAYAISYKPQKIVASYQGGEKPSALYLGHYHKLGKFYTREVHTVMCGCVSDQSMFMRKKALRADVAGIITEIHLSEDGIITRFIYEEIPFFDRGFYDDWDYASMWD